MECIGARLIIIEFSGKKTRTENVQQNGGVNLGAFQIGGEKVKGTERDDSLVRTAGEDAIDNIKEEIQNALAKRGYILEKRTYESKTIFKVSLGSLDGIKHGDKFEVIGEFENENPITGENEVERRILTKGTITDKIDPKISWVVIDDADQIGSVRLGDMIKMKYKKSAFASTAKLAKSLIEQ